MPHNDGHYRSILPVIKDGGHIHLINGFIITDWLAQLVEHSLSSREVVGSFPARSYQRLGVQHKGSEQGDDTARIVRLCRQPLRFIVKRFEHP